ncbi:unnamed protein product [Closterium sp. NIES-54]
MLLARTLRCVVGFFLNGCECLFYHPSSHHFFHFYDVTFEDSFSFYTRFPHRGTPISPPPLFIIPSPPPGPTHPLAPLPRRPAPSGVSHVIPFPLVGPMGEIVACRGLSRPVVGGPVTERAGSGGATSRDAGHGGAGSGVANVGALAASDDSACDCASPFLPLNWLPSSPLLTVSPGFRSLASSLGTSPARFPPSLPQSPPLLPDPSLASSPWASRPPRAQPPKSSL